MAMRLAVMLLFLYSTPIVSAAQPVPGELEATTEFPARLTGQLAIWP
jgi:hypothetical protein